MREFKVKFYRCWRKPALSGKPAASRPTWACRWVIWVVLASYAFLLVAFVLFVGVESLAGHLLFTIAFAVSVALVLVLVRMLDYPFEGALALGGDDFVNTFEHVTVLVEPS